MNLHKDKDAFEELITATANDIGLGEFQVEKDYYVSYMLKHIVGVSPEIVFKGGTSLSKCYKTIKRFSEDIDINFKINSDVKTADKKQLKKDLLAAIEKSGLTLLNDLTDDLEQIRSTREFNKYLVGYPKIFESSEQMKDHIIIESFVFYKAFPCEKIPVSNYITEYLEKNDEQVLIAEYNLEPFEMYVQTIERTFLDKIFAICDYHEEGKHKQNSRHFYDIHMIWSTRKFEMDSLRSLFLEVVEERRKGLMKKRHTYSSAEGYPIIQKLNEIIQSEVYKKDYEENTTEFLFEEVDYDTTIETLKNIINSDLLPDTIQ